jgi:uncharacterized protein YciI
MSDDAAPQHYFLIIQRAIGDPGRVGPHLAAHQAWLKEQLAEERLVLTGTGQTEEAPGPDAGFLLVRADDFEDARRVVETDPFIREGVRSYEPLRVTPMNGLLRFSFWGAAGALA